MSPQTREIETSKLEDFVNIVFVKIGLSSFIGAFLGLYSEGKIKGAMVGALVSTALIGLPLASSQSRDYEQVGQVY